MTQFLGLNGAQPTNQERIHEGCRRGSFSAVVLGLARPQNLRVSLNGIFFLKGIKYDQWVNLGVADSQSLWFWIHTSRMF